MKTDSLAKGSHEEYVIIQVRWTGKSPSELKCQVLTDDNITTIPQEYHRHYGYTFTFKHKILALIIRRMLHKAGDKWVN